MCTDFCICKGTPNDQWVKDYEALDDSKYSEFDRNKVVGQGGYQGVVDIARTGDKPMFWTYDVDTKENK